MKCAAAHVRPAEELVVIFKSIGRVAYVLFALFVIAVAVWGGLRLKELIDTTAGQTGVAP